MQLSRLLSVRWLLIGLGVAIAIALYVAEVPGNPPGFFVDESSIAYNAYTISQHGVDEYGTSWPLFFRAFGEYKNPVLIYLLASLYSVFGPSQFLARLLSALLVLAAALLLGALSGRATRSRTVGIIVGASACLTPWLFELSRLVFEVAFLPLAVALFLWALQVALTHDPPHWLHSIALALTLSLITYSSGVGRVLAPLFCCGLLLCGSKNRWLHFGQIFLFYGLTLIPLIWFWKTNPNALETRWAQVTYFHSGATRTEISLRFLGNYFRCFNPWDWLVAGDSEPRHHLATMGSLLFATAALACGGLVLFFTQRLWREPWWRFVVFGLLVAPIPNALTIDRFHTLRLIALPMFVLLLTAPALAWLLERSLVKRVVLATVIGSTLLQGALFQWQFHAAGGQRWHAFDTFYPEVFAAAIARPERPIYLVDRHGAPGYIHAYWYGLFHGLKKSDFVRITPHKSAKWRTKAFSTGERPPPGALLISCEFTCPECDLLLERASFRAYIVH
jgi:4-amino-4-deoxy-L-arabinose transferase-like glycosyltransferase